VSGVSVFGVFVFPQPVSEGVGVRVVASRGWCVDPVFSPDGGFVAYSSNASGSFDVWLVDVGGRGGVRVTCLEGDERGPQFSPDGRWIAFVHEYEGVEDLFVFDRVGLGVVRLTEDGAPKGRFEWSPRGGLLVYDVFQGGGWGVWVADVVGGFRWRVCGGECFDPSWSGDGRFIVCVGREAENHTLQIIDFNTGESRRIYSAKAPIRYPSFSASNDRVFFLMNTTSGWSIYAFQMLEGYAENLFVNPVRQYAGIFWDPIVDPKVRYVVRRDQPIILFAGYSTKSNANLFTLRLDVELDLKDRNMPSIKGTKIERIDETACNKILGLSLNYDNSKAVYSKLIADQCSLAVYELKKVERGGSPYERG